MPDMTWVRIWGDLPSYVREALPPMEELSPDLQELAAKGFGLWRVSDLERMERIMSVRSRASRSGLIRLGLEQHLVLLRRVISHGQTRNTNVWQAYAIDDDVRTSFLVDLESGAFSAIKTPVAGEPADGS